MRNWHKDGACPINKSEWIFVFGSNTLGNHAGGAAACAKENFGAKDGASVGIVGFNSYGIATLDSAYKQLPIHLIAIQIMRLEAFIKGAGQMDLKFFITRIGCGIAGFKDEEIAPMFAPLVEMPNVSLPETWKPIIGEGNK